MSSCSYSCSEQPDTVTPYTDISGIGVIVGYVGSAGIVVLILLIYYLSAYDPAKDPFRKEDGTRPSTQPILFRSNPFDVCLLGIKDQIKSLLTRYGLVNKTAGSHNTRLEAACLKCVLSMSDLQILTGISILISGFAQLTCGISCFHWQLLTYLAWFSSLTHLACLTVLRNYLYTHQAERAWRLVAMGIFVLMLLVAIVPTGNYDWPSGLAGSFSDDDPDPGTMILPSNYAICFLGRSNMSDPLTFASMIISFLFVLLGFLSRVVRLHKSLSIDIVARARQAASEKARNWLRKVYLWSDIERSPNGVRRLFIYRPLLALFLTLRIGLDAWSSMFIEVFWLLTAFLWGILKLLSTLLLFPQGDSDWTFGQVIPVVLLAAPLLAVAEYMYPEDSKEEIRPTSPDVNTISPSGPATIPAVAASYNTTISTTNPSTTSSPVTTRPAADNSTSSTSPPGISPPSTSAASPSAPNTSAGSNPSPNTQSRVQTLQIANATYSIPPDRVRDDPDYDFFTQSHWYKTFVVFVSIDIMLSAIQILVLYSTGSEKLIQVLIPSGGWILAALGEWLPSDQLITLVLYILHALLIETVRAHPSPWTRPETKTSLAQILTVCNLAVLFAAQMNFPELSYILWWYLAFYPCCALAYTVFG